MTSVLICQVEWCCSRFCNSLMVSSYNFRLLISSFCRRSTSGSLAMRTSSLSRLVLLKMDDWRSSWENCFRTSWYSMRWGKLSTMRWQMISCIVKIRILYSRISSSTTVSVGVMAGTATVRGGKAYSDRGRASKTEKNLRYLKDLRLLCLFLSFSRLGLLWCVAKSCSVIEVPLSNWPFVSVGVDSGASWRAVVQKELKSTMIYKQIQRENKGTLHEVRLLAGAGFGREIFTGGLESSSKSSSFSSLIAPFVRFNDVVILFVGALEGAYGVRADWTIVVVRGDSVEFCL